ncbi:hypothetical protein ACHAXA_000954 [Cyclostephanos tholiformis]|uniref:Uncharacterized protein n=1 Tax=Cyclostephanos tholiformis TaxID=382380 RepID=A0ABD3R4S1_9STRA
MAFVIRVRTNAGTYRVTGLDPHTSRVSDLISSFSTASSDAYRSCNVDGMYIVDRAMFVDSRRTVELDPDGTLADRGLHRSGALVYCRVAYRDKSYPSRKGSSQFVPFHLFETTTIAGRRLGNKNDDPRATRYFRTLRQMVGMDDECGNRYVRRGYHFLFVFNFLVDISYLLEQLTPEIFHFHRVVVFYGDCGSDDGTATLMNEWRQRSRMMWSSDNTVEFVRVVPTDPPNSRTNPLRTKMRYGCHHTKMFIMGYRDEDECDGTTSNYRCRLVVQTANLTRDDIECKTQGAYCQDFPLKKDRTTTTTTTPTPTPTTIATTTTNVADTGKKDVVCGERIGKMPGAVLVDNPYKRKRAMDVIGDTGGCAATATTTAITRGRDGGGGGGSSPPPYDEDDDTPFEDELINYLESYRYMTRQTWYHDGGGNAQSWGGGYENRPMNWLRLLRQYDYSSAYVVLLPSVPGYHDSNTYNDLGYMKLRRAIMENVCPHRQDCGATTTQQQQQQQQHRAPVLCQFSSIGSLNKPWLDRFVSAIDSSSTCAYDPINDHMSGPAKGGGVDASRKVSPPLSSRMKIIWPTVEEIRNSVEGYGAGGAIPGRVANLDKDFLKPLYHRWSSSSNDDGEGNHSSLRTARHAPHIKTYVQPSDSDPNSIEWLALASHNLSIAAWGRLQKASAQGGRDDRVLFISNWELGVFMSPATLVNAIRLSAVANSKRVRMVAYPGPSSVINVDDSEDEGDENSTIILPIPYDINPTPYNASDVFWAVDRDYFGDPELE